MASLRDIRRRVKSIGNTAQITRAMQMVAASKMRKAQEAALTTRPSRMKAATSASMAWAARCTAPSMAEASSG